MLFKCVPVLVRGGGDLASGVIYRFHRAGFPVVVTELETPLFVRRAVSYGDAVYRGEATVEAITARLVPDVESIGQVLAAGEIPVLVDADGASLSEIRPVVVVDARMKKNNPGTSLDDAPLVVALGPGFVAGFDCHAVIETNRGHNLGRVIYKGTAEPDTGVPGNVNGHARSRVLRSPAIGHVEARAEIGETIDVGQVVATVAGQPISAAFQGVLRGLVHERVMVETGMKIGDLDPRARRENCFTISEKSLAVGGGVLEAVLAAPAVHSCFDDRPDKA